MDQRISRTIQFIETNYSLAVSLQELTKRAHLSRSRFRTLFKTETGLSPMRYVKEFRIRKAGQLLDGSEPLGIKQVMTDVGFMDKSQFTKSFKQVFGVPPSEYRQRAARSRVSPNRSEGKADSGREVPLVAAREIGAPYNEQPLCTTCGRG